MKILICLISFFIFTHAHAQASKGSSSIGVGPGVAFTHIDQKIPGSGANLNATSLQFTYFNASYFGLLTNRFAIAFDGTMGTELFRVDGALRVPDDDVTIYDASLETRWALNSADSWSSPHSFAPIAMLGLEMTGLPVLGMPEALGRLYTVELLNTLSPTVGLGTGLYFSGVTFLGAVRMGYPFTAGTQFHVNHGRSLALNLDSNFVMGGMGNVGVNLWAKRAVVDFDSVDPVTHTPFDNKYIYASWGFKLYYRILF